MLKQWKQTRNGPCTSQTLTFTTAWALSERRAIRGPRSTEYAVRSMPRRKACRLLHVEKHHQSWFAKFICEIIDILIIKQAIGLKISRDSWLAYMFIITMAEWAKSINYNWNLIHCYRIPLRIILTFGNDGNKFGWHQMRLTLDVRNNK